MMPLFLKTRAGQGRVPDAILLAAMFLLAAMLAAVGCSEVPSGDPTYPSRPITVVVPFSTGGGTDSFARIIKKAIDDQQLLPQPLVIINQGGAGGTIGSRRVKDAEPDGYTMLVLHNTIFTAKYSGAVEYGPEVFEPIAATGEVGLVIAVRDDSPFADLNQLMHFAQQHPDRLTYAANIGAVVHFVGMQMEQGFPGARFRFVQSGGGADRFAELKGGHVDLTGFSIEEFVRFRADGLRGLAYCGADRHPGAADVPTAREQGLDIATGNTFFWWFPQGVARAKVDVIADALQQAMQTDFVRQRLEESQCQPTFARGSALHRMLNQRVAELAAVDVRDPPDLPNLPALAFWTTAALTAVVLFQSRHKIATKVEQWRGRAIMRDGGATANRRRWLAAGFVVASVLYLTAMHSGLLGFRSATAIFVLSTGGVLSRFRGRTMVPLIVLAIALSFGFHAIFTRVFSIDLP